MYSGALRRSVLAGAFALLALAPGVLVSGEAKAGWPAVEQDYFDIDQFYDELAPFGEWVDHPDHGYVWLPRKVGRDWRPYTLGNWVSTEEYGWYWDSPEPFAWAVYHYGRWGFEPDYGWYWVPGDTWAPAWVQWRYGDEYVGWAPEVPTAGHAYGGPARYAPPPPRDSWVFVEPRYLVSPAVRSARQPDDRIQPHDLCEPAPLPERLSLKLRHAARSLVARHAQAHRAAQGVSRASKSAPEWVEQARLS